jgi:hypothetical protein
LQRLRADKSRSQFEELHPHAFLISSSWRNLRPTLPAAKLTTTRPSIAPPSEALAETFILPRSDEQRVSLTPQSHEILILPVTKAPSHAFAELISIGRAPTCDIVIRDPSVSKLHGYFSAVTRESVIYTDARSANSTYVDGVTVPPGVAVEIRALGLIAVGRVRLQLIAAGDLYDWL